MPISRTRQEQEPIPGTPLGCRIPRLSRDNCEIGISRLTPISELIDELGFVPFDRAGGELLFNLLSDRYETRSTAITSNLNFGEWVQVFGDEKLTTALLDRLGHHAHILLTRGPSRRKRQDEEGGAI